MYSYVINVNEVFLNWWKYDIISENIKAFADYVNVLTDDDDDWIVSESQ